ncbi:MAG: hypothetical protein HYS18_07075 [Burkholderiales bacterium]|nr:hypothetical protein [Burkholderiales bacterium]
MKRISSKLCFLFFALAEIGGMSMSAHAEMPGIKWLTEPNKFSKNVQQNEYFDCKLDVLKDAKPMDILLKTQARYEYHLRCNAKKPTVLRELRIGMEEVVESKNTHVGKMERSRRDLDAVKPTGDADVKLLPGKPYEQRGMLTVPHHAINKSGRIFTATARVSYPEEAKKIDVTADRERNPTKYLLRLEVKRS